MAFREETMLTPVRGYLARAGYSRVYDEVPFFHCVMDVFAASDSLETVAVEMKVSKWRQALRQARVYQLCADRVYIAVAAEFAHRVRTEELDRLGIGLLTVALSEDECGREVGEVVPAHASTMKREHYTDRLLRRLGERDAG